MKKQLIIVIIAVIVIGVGVAVYFFIQSEDANTNTLANSASQTNTSASTNTKSANMYSGEDFTILNPSDWTQSQVAGSLVSFHHANEVQPEGSAAKEVNFFSYMAVAFEMANERSLTEINDFVIAQIKEAVPSTEVISSSDETVDGQSAMFNVFTMTQQEVDITVFLAVILKGDKYYTVSGNTTTDKWTEYKDLFYETARSFVFKD